MRQLTIALLCAAPLFSQPVTVDGDWVAVTSFFDMKDYNRLTLHQQGSEITGAAGNLKLTGAIHGRDVEMEGKDERGATASFKGVVANGEIIGDATWRGNPQKFRAYRPSARPADEPRRRRFESQLPGESQAPGEIRQQLEARSRKRHRPPRQSYWKAQGLHRPATPHAGLRRRRAPRKNGISVRLSRPLRRKHGLQQD